MIVYEELLRLPRFISPKTQLRYIAAAFVLVSYMWWSELHVQITYQHILSILIPGIILAWDVLPVFMILNAALFPEVRIHIDEKVLRLKRGFIRKEIPLDSIKAVSQVSPSSLEVRTTPQSLYKNSDFLFLNRNHLPSVELSFFGGESKHVATARPEELASMLRFQAERLRRESASRMTAAHSPE
jgi:hypothetical protein